MNIKLLEDFRRIHDSRNFIFRLVNKDKLEKVNIAEDFLRKVVDSSDFCMCMSFESLEKVLIDDDIKEITETGVGSTRGGVSTRREAIESLYGLQSETYPVKEMPKYGFLVGKNHEADLAKDFDIFYHYGDVMLTFKKENLMGRTTMTVGSSLDFTESFLKTPTYVDDPKFICIKGHPTKFQHNGYFMGLDFMVDHLIKEKKLDPNKPNSLALESDDMIGFENFEIQIFGKLSVSQDVKSIDYIDLSPNAEEKAKSIGPLLEKYNLKLGKVFRNFL